MSSSRTTLCVENPAWAFHFDAATRHTTQHAAFPRFWRNPAILRDLILNCFASLNDRQGDTPNLRIFVNRGLRYDLQQRLLDPVVQQTRSFESWIQRLIGYKKFCLTLNGATRWSEPLHVLMQRQFINPMIAALGSPLGGLDFYCFVGNYGSTPFGIHQDAEHSLLLHLGPCPKKVYLWPRRRYEKLQPRKLPESYLKTRAITYTLKAGDLLFIPKGDYHLLESPRFSVSLGCSVFPATPRFLLSQIIDLFPEGASDSEPFFVRGNPRIRSGYSTCQMLLGKSPEDAIHSYLLLLRSNGYVTAPPGECLRRFAMADLFRCRFQVPMEFPILCSHTAKSLQVTMRGRSLRVRFHPSLLAAINRVNDHREFSYEDFANKLRRALDESAIIHLFRQLLRFRGIKAILESSAGTPDKASQDGKL